MCTAFYALHSFTKVIGEFFLLGWHHYLRMDGVLPLLRVDVEYRALRAGQMVGPGWNDFPRSSDALRLRDRGQAVQGREDQLVGSGQTVVFNEFSYGSHVGTWQSCAYQVLIWSNSLSSILSYLFWNGSLKQPDLWRAFCLPTQGLWIWHELSEESRHFWAPRRRRWSQTGWLADAMTCLPGNSEAMTNLHIVVKALFRDFEQKY